MSSVRKYAEWKEKGLCTSCGGVRDNPNRQECNACARHHSELRKAEKAYYLNVGICPVCRKNRLTDGRKRCPACTEKMAERHIRYGYTRERVRVYENERRRRLKEQGLCVICGKVAIEGQTMCVECKRKTTEKRHLKEKERAIWNE